MTHSSGPLGLCWSVARSKGSLVIGVLIVSEKTKTNQYLNIIPLFAPAPE